MNECFSSVTKVSCINPLSIPYQSTSYQPDALTFFDTGMEWMVLGKLQIFLDLLGEENSWQLIHELTTLMSHGKVAMNTYNTMNTAP